MMLQDKTRRLKIEEQQKMILELRDTILKKQKKIFKELERQRLEEKNERQ